MAHVNSQLESARKAAESLINELFTGAHDQSLFVVIGAGNPFLFLGLRERLQPWQTILVVDHCAVDTRAVESEGIVFSCGESLPALRTRCEAIAESLPEPRYAMCAEPSFDPARRAALAAMDGPLRAMIGGALGEVATERHNIEGEVRNTILNMPSLLLRGGVASLKNSHVGRTAVVVGAGPSLGAQLAWLVRNRSALVVVAVGSAVKAMEAAGVVPDFYVEIDPRSHDHWEGRQSVEATLVYMPGITPWLPLLFERAFCFDSIAGGAAWRKTLLRELQPEIDWLDVESNTGLAAAAAAVYRGCHRVVLLGVDLCLSPEGCSHSQWHSHGADKVAAGGGAEMVENNRGESCRTLFMGFIKAFEHLFARHADVEFIQASEAGARLAGALYKTLEMIEMPQVVGVPVASPGMSLVSEAEALKRVERASALVVNALDDEADSMSVAEGPALVLRKIINANLATLKRWRWSEFAANPSMAARREREKARRLVLGDLAIARAAAEQALKTKPSSASIARMIVATHYPDVEAPCDLEGELAILAENDPDLADVVDRYFERKRSTRGVIPLCKLAWQRRHMVQLRVWSEAAKRHVATVGYYDLLKTAQELVCGAFAKWRDAGVTPETVVCAGLFDSNYIWLLRDKWPWLRLVVVEPSIELFAETLRLVPLVTIGGEGTRFIVGVQPSQTVEALRAAGIDPAAKTLGLICPDPDGRHLPYLGELSKALSVSLPRA